MKEAVIIGYSGHAYVVLDLLLANKYSIKGYCENRVIIENPYKLVYLGSENNYEVYNSIKHVDIFIAIGDNAIRKSIIENLLEKGSHLPSLIHPSAIVSDTVTMQGANVVMPGVVINSCARLGKGIICNSSSIIEHECQIGDYVHIAPGAVLTGNVSIGNNSFIGANAVIKPGIKISDNVIIGAGAVVTKNIDSGEIVAGNPANPINI
ncbi:acetyltransferase [Pedobacter sp. P351]|uniref:acetyltransferase n=1 Tax=Pedobacter superstes TaxID=3133441 RepID=UPI0030A35DF1